MKSLVMFAEVEGLMSTITNAGSKGGPESGYGRVVMQLDRWKDRTFGRSKASSSDML